MGKWKETEGNEVWKRKNGKVWSNILRQYLEADDSLALTGAEPLSGIGQGQFLSAEDLVLHTQSGNGNDSILPGFPGVPSPSESKEKT